jgi:hypothetical protein
LPGQVFAKEHFGEELKMVDVKSLNLDAENYL